MVVSLVDALQDRASLILQLIADRANAYSYPEIGHFAGYKASEGLIGELNRFPQDDGSPGYIIEYKRPGDTSQSAIRLLFPKMIDIKERHKTEPTTVVSGIVDKEVIERDLPAGVTETYTVEKILSKSSSRIVSYSEASKKAWEVAAKASLSVEYAGVKGALEIAGKYGEELNRSSSESETSSHSESNRETDTLEFVGPVKFKLEAFRSRDKESRTITAVCDFDFRIAIDPGGEYKGIIYYSSFINDFLPTIKRIAPNDATYYKEFMAHWVSQYDIDKVSAPSNKVVQFVVEYDNVKTSSLKNIA